MKLPPGFEPDPNLAKDSHEYLLEFEGEEQILEAKEFGDIDHMVRVLINNHHCPPGDVFAFREELERLQHDTPSQILRKAAAKTYPSLEEAKPVLADHGNGPRWPSGINLLDCRAGGMYGLTVVGGESGVGKSMLAIGASLAAAQRGWRVVYANAELKLPEIGRRIVAFLGVNAEPLRRWHCIDVFDGVSLQSFIHLACDRVLPMDEQVLIVIDSINSFTRKQGARGTNIFDALNDITAFAETCVRKSNGNIGMLLVSELTRAGGVKGATAEYVCDLDIRMKHSKSSDKNIVEISTDKGREGGGNTDYGRYHPNFLTCRFESLAVSEMEEI